MLIMPKSCRSAVKFILILMRLCTIFRFTVANYGLILEETKLHYDFIPFSRFHEPGPKIHGVMIVMPHSSPQEI